MSASPFWEGTAEINSHPSSPCSVSLILSNSKKEAWVNDLKSVFLTIYSHFNIDLPSWKIIDLFLYWPYNTDFSERGKIIFF